MTIVCSRCRREVAIPETVGFREICPSCDAWLHSCLQCRFWTGRTCSEPAAEHVRDPEGQNFCEWFTARTGDAESGTEEGGGRASAEDLWRKLVKKKQQ